MTFHNPVHDGDSNVSAVAMAASVKADEDSEDEDDPSGHRTAGGRSSGDPGGRRAAGGRSVPKVVDWQPTWSINEVARYIARTLGGEAADQGAGNGAGTH